jgi:negative regulator of replication initiation
MTGSNSDPGSDTTRTTIEVDREVWRKVRSQAVAEGENVSDMLEFILADYFDMQNDE